MKRKNHKNIPIFIPHLGCPNDCVFCNQRTISGQMYFDESSVERQISEAVSTLPPDAEAEIAFFGGSFTGIDRDLMIRLLTLSDKYVKCGAVTSVRCSTRPDYIDGEILSILSAHHVKTVELGIQSMSDRVLEVCRRGHNAETSVRACRMVKEAGFSLIGQMMVGLPGAMPEDETSTAEAICDMGADGARVYPTVVFRKTALCAMAQNGEYTPLDTETAVERTKNVLDVFDRRGADVIRVGLCASDNLSSPDEVYGGASHPAIGELAMGELFYERECALMETLPDRPTEKHTAVFYVPAGAASRAAGQKRRNILRLYEKYSALKGINRIKILENNEQIGYNIKIGIL